MTATSTFDPRPCLKKLNGKDYLEVVYRLQWLRAEHPDATITTKLEHLDWEAGYAVFHARVEIPGQGIAEGTGSETRQAFPAGWLEKAETVAVGRALAMLGFGTAFALADFEEGHLADAPVEMPATTAMAPTNGHARAVAPPIMERATPSQVDYLKKLGGQLRMSPDALEVDVEKLHGGRGLNLVTRAEASKLIDTLKIAASAAAKERPGV